MGLGIASGFGAGAAGNALTDILKQKFLEQIQKAKLAEDIRQADMANNVAQGRLGIERGGLELGQQRFGLDQQKLGEDTRQFDVGAGFKGRELGMQEQAQPLKLKQIGAATAQDEAQTAEIQRRPTAEAEQRTFQTGRDAAQAGYRLSEIGAQGANALKVAQQRPDKWQVVDRPDGGKVRVNLDTGEEVPLDVAGKTGAAGKGAVSQEYVAERRARVLQSVDELGKKVTPFTTGAGSLLSYLPGTTATDFASELETLKSNIAFSELAEMRQASKTGGALGQVSDKEGTLLQSTLGALNVRQSPANFKAQLQKIRGSLERWQKAKAASDGGVIEAPKVTVSSMQEIK